MATRPAWPATVCTCVVASGITLTVRICGCEACTCCGKGTMGRMEAVLGARVTRESGVLGAMRWG